MPEEKKESILDHAMRGHRVVLGCDFDDSVNLGHTAYMASIFILVSPSGLTFWVAGILTNM